jgi:hypothetical protein
MSRAAALGSIVMNDLIGMIWRDAGAPERAKVSIATE